MGFSPCRCKHYLPDLVVTALQCQSCYIFQTGSAGGVRLASPKISQTHISQYLGTHWVGHRGSIPFLDSHNLDLPLENDQEIGLPDVADLNRERAGKYGWMAESTRERYK